MYTAGDTNMATLQIHHNLAYPSKIILPSTYLVLGAQDDQKMNTGLVYPNPVAVNLNLKYISADAIIEITDIKGRLMLNGVNTTNSINLEDFGRGIYFLKVKNEGKESLFKIVKE